jgi:hypothetical protein
MYATRTIERSLHRARKQSDSSTVAYAGGNDATA